MFSFLQVFCDKRVAINDSVRELELVNVNLNLHPSELEQARGNRQLIDNTPFSFDFLPLLVHLSLYHFARLEHSFMKSWYYH